MSQQQSRLRRYASMSTLLLVGQVAYYAVYFWGIRLILSTLPKVENGVLTFVQQWATTAFSIALMTGYNTYLVHQLRSSEARVELFSTVVWLRLGISIGAASCLALILSAVGSVSPMVTIAGSAAVLLMTSSNTLRTTVELHFQSRMQFGVIVLHSILDVLLIVLLLWWHRAELSALTVFSLQALGALPSFIVLIALAWRDGVLRTRFDRTVLSALFRNAAPLGLVTVFIYAHLLIDITLLDMLSGKQAVGIFGAASYASIPLNVLQGVLWTPLVPFLSQSLTNDVQSARSELTRALRLSLLVIGMAGSVLAAAMPLVIELLTKGAYRDHRSEFLLQVWVVTFSAIVFALQHYGTLLGQYRITIASVGTLALGSILFDWWLIDRLSTAGLLIAKILSNASACCIGAVLLAREGYPELGRVIGRLLVWLAATGVGVGWLYALLPDCMVGRGVAIVGSAAVAAAALGIVQWDDRRTFRKLLRCQASAV